MSQEEILIGNNEICRMLGWPCLSLYHYECPNIFPLNENSGYMELRCDAIGFNTDWNMLIGAYNVALSKLNNNELVKNLLKRDEHFIANFGIKNFFGLFENQLYISSSWIKLVDFCKLYNAVI